MSIERILAMIPGWEDAVVSVLDGGLTNRSYLLESSGRRAVMKTDAAPRQAAGLANKVLYVDETTLLTEFVEGEVWSAEHFDDDERLGRLGERLREVHSLPLTGRTFDANAAAAHYAAALPDTDAAREHVGLIASLPQSENLCCCHNDLVAANIGMVSRSVSTISGPVIYKLVFADTGFVHLDAGHSIPRLGIRGRQRPAFRSGHHRCAPRSGGIAGRSATGRLLRGRRQRVA